MSILPQVERGDHLPPWAVSLRDKDTAWMSVAQQGVIPAQRIADSDLRRGALT
jgi:hypothetical protein